MSEEIEKIADGKFKVCGELFEVGERYEITELLGNGAYGIVVLANDFEAPDPENNQVALKKVLNVFERRIISKRILREIKIMRLLNHENLNSLLTILENKPKPEMNELYLVQEVMENDLKYILDSQQKLSE